MVWHQAQFFSASSLPWVMSLSLSSSQGRRLAEPFQAVLGADKSRIERERAAEIGRGGGLSPRAS